MEFDCKAIITSRGNPTAMQTTKAISDNPMDSYPGAIVGNLAPAYQEAPIQTPTTNVLAFTWDD